MYSKEPHFTGRTFRLIGTGRKEGDRGGKYQEGKEG